MGSCANMVKMSSWGGSGVLREEEYQSMVQKLAGEPQDQEM